jgi:hypothetical protein
MLSVNWKHVQLVKIYMPCNFEVNLITRLGVITLFIPPLPGGGGGYTVLPLSVLPSVQDIFCRIFLSNYWWQESDIWSQASYRYSIPYRGKHFWTHQIPTFLFADLVGFYTHWTYMRGYHKWALVHSSSCFIIYFLI